MQVKFHKEQMDTRLCLWTVLIEDQLILMNLLSIIVLSNS